MIDMKCYVVLCEMEGCDECSNVTHVVGVFMSKKLATEAETKHSAEANPKFPEHSKLEGHYHFCYVNTEEVEVDLEIGGI